jgi:uncharacterized protein (TIGR00269 family)
VKPLFRTSERETAAYAFLRGIDYVVEECPFSRGATSITHKMTLDRLEDASPGTKASFVLGFLDRARGLFEAAEGPSLTECARCGQTTTGQVCAFCKLRDQVKRSIRPVAGPALGPTDPESERGLIADLRGASEILAP